jgi:hypothetical protein
MRVQIASDNHSAVSSSFCPNLSVALIRCAGEPKDMVHAFGSQPVVIPGIWKVHACILEAVMQG